MLNTQSRLVLRDRPGFFAAIMLAWGVASLYLAATAEPGNLEMQIGLTLTGVFVLGAAWFFFPMTTIVLDRDAGVLAFETKRIGRVSTKAVPLEQVRRATVQSLHSDGGVTERLVVLTEGGPVPLEQVYTSSPRVPVTRQINTWLGVA